MSQRKSIQYCRFFISPVLPRTRIKTNCSVWQFWLASIAGLKDTNVLGTLLLQLGIFFEEEDEEKDEVDEEK